MIILFDKDYNVANTYGQVNNTLGIGVLRDAISCVVTEELNGVFELEMEYPISGAHYKDLDVEKIIFTQPNDETEPQPFRIYKITRPIDGIVTIYAQHISYDTGSIPIRAINAENLDDLTAKINDRKYQVIESPFIFKLSSEKQGSSTTTFQTLVPYSLRTLLLGDDKSVLNVYEGDFIFDRNKIILSERRGQNRDFVIRYAKNMTDLEYESSSEVIYDGICPYYNSKVTETKTKAGFKYKAIYLSSEHGEAENARIPNPEAGPNTPEKTTQWLYPKEWLAYNDGGSAISTIVTFTVVNIIETNSMTEFDDPSLNFCPDGELIRGKKLKIEGQENEYWYEIVTYKKAYINPNQPEFERNWLCEDPELSSWIDPTQDPWNPEDLPIGTGENEWNPEMHRNIIYRVYTEGDKQYKVYIWKKKEGTDIWMYMEPESSDKIDECKPSMPNLGSYSEEKDNTILYEGDIIYVNEKRARINENATEYSADWLIEVEEKIQTKKDNPRWEDVDESHTPINPNLPENLNINYKVIKEEVLKGTASDPDGEIITVEGKKETDRDLLRYKNQSVSINPENNQGYYVESSNPKTLGQHFYLRWNEFDKKYEYITDTRYTYINYVWNGTQYVARVSTRDKILTVDLTDKFSEQPSDSAKFQKELYDAGISYIKENKIGQVKDSIKVSFTKLSASPEYSKWRELEKVSLGDTVTVIYEDLGINAQKKVIKTEYNVLTGSYDNIELGEKLNKFTDNAIVSGDNVSALTNNRNFADKLTASNIAAKAVEADYLKAVTADITEANITNLTTEEISATLITAQTFAIDELVSKLLITDNAVVKETLTSGEITVNGNINVKSGSISITDNPDFNSCTAYINDEATEGEYGGDWLCSDKELENIIYPDTEKYPLDTIYKVHSKNGVWTQEYYIWDTNTDKYIQYHPNINTYFEVDETGNVLANSLTLNGGEISIKLIPDNAYINPNAETYSRTWLARNPDGTNIIVPDPDVYYLIKTSGTYENKYYTWNLEQDKYIEQTYIPDSSFEVDKYGHVEATSMVVTNGQITSTDGILNGISSIRVDDVVSGNIYNSDTVQSKNLEVDEKISIDDVEIYQDVSYKYGGQIYTQINTRITTNPNVFNKYDPISGKIKHRFILTINLAQYPEGDIKTTSDLIVTILSNSYVYINQSETNSYKYYFLDHNLEITLSAGINNSSASIEFDVYTVGYIQSITKGQILHSQSTNYIDYYVKESNSATAYIKADAICTNGDIGSSSSKINNIYSVNINSSNINSSNVISRNIYIKQNFPVFNHFVISGHHPFFNDKYDDEGYIYLPYYRLFEIEESSISDISGITILSVVVTEYYNDSTTSYPNVKVRFDSQPSDSEKGIRIYTNNGNLIWYNVICTYKLR